MLEVSNGLSSQIVDAKVLFTGQLVLTADQRKFRYTDETGMKILVEFSYNGTYQQEVQTSNEGNNYTISLINFGSPLGMAASGKISAIRPGSQSGRGGAWQLKYNLVVQTLPMNGPDSTKIVSFTLAEARVA